MLQPKRTKFRKVQTGRNRGLAKGTDVSFGEFGLKAVGRGRLTARQIEAARRGMTIHQSARLGRGSTCRLKGGTMKMTTQRALMGMPAAGKILNSIQRFNGC